MTLTAEQLAAVESPARATFVSAGPGSGKSRVIAARAAYLIRDRRERPDSILVLTFTRAACAEIRARIEADAGSGCDVVTFDAFAARVALAELEGLKLSVADDYAEKAVVDGLYSGPTRRPRRGLVGRQALENAITAWSAGRDREISRDALGDVMLARHRLAEAGLIARWDLMRRALQVPFQKLPRYRHLLVDEGQDCSPAELVMVARLAGASDAAVLVVGSPEQAIYSWRGAAEDPAGLVDELLPPASAPARRLTLSRTFRFGGSIAAVANRVSARFGGLQVSGAEDVHDEVLDVDLGGLRGEVEDGLEFGQTVLVLARTHRECAFLADIVGDRGRHVRRDPLDPMSSEGDRIRECFEKGIAAICTAHGAKGTEADRVVAAFDPDCDEREVEEYRVKYVAVSRARRRCAILAPVDGLTWEATKT